MHGKQRVKAMTGWNMRIKRGLCAALAFAMLAAVPAGADTLRSAMADAYRNSALLEQNRYLLRVRD